MTTYSKQTWVNAPAITSPLNATRLNHMEDGIESTSQDLDAVIAGIAASSGNIINVKAAPYNAVGDGTTDDSVAIKSAQAATTTGKVLYFPPGSYRFTQQFPTGNAALFFSGVSNISIYMDPGAELLMDNLSSGVGTGHGVMIYGACSNISLINVRVRWATQPSSRSFGDGIHFLGFPSDSAPGGGWTTTTGKITNAQVVNCSVISAPQAGIIFHGCSDVRVVNSYVNSTMADGLHFAACRRVNVNGHTAIDAGDDGLAFVTLYDPTLVAQSVDGPFYQPSLGQWSNYNSQATGIVVSGGLADGVRIGGSYHVNISDVNISGKANAGIIVDSAIIGGGVAWTYHASVGISISNTVIDTCPIGFLVVAENINSSSNAAFYQFGLSVDRLTVRNSSNWSIFTQGDGSTSSIISGLQFSNIKVTTSASSGGFGSIGFSSVRNSQFSNIILDSASSSCHIMFFGQDGAGSGNQTIACNVMVDNLFNNGPGAIQFIDLKNLYIGQMFGANIVYLRCANRINVNTTTTP